MKLSTLPKEFVTELLVYIAEKETFTETTKALGDGVSATEIKAALREIASELQKELATEKSGYDVAGCDYLSKHSKKIIACLSPLEETNLLKAFGLIEKS